MKSSFIILFTDASASVQFLFRKAMQWKTNFYLGGQELSLAPDNDLQDDESSNGAGLDAFRVLSS